MQKCITLKAFVILKDKMKTRNIKTHLEMMTMLKVCSKQAAGYERPQSRKTG
jgi:hypothetical protein